MREAALAAYRRGDEAAAQLLQAALDEAPGDGELLIAHAAANALAGSESAFDRLEKILSQAPDWIDGHKAVARLKSEFGHPSPMATIENALAVQPDNPRLWMAYLSLLSGAGKHAQASEIVAKLRKEKGDMPPLRVLEARHAGFAGDTERADALLASVSSEVPDRDFELARNCLRLGDLDCASESLDRVLKDAPGDIGAWALAELCWRARQDARHEWLLPKNLLTEQVSLGLSEDEIDTISDLIRSFHRTSAAPLGQSVRGGTQTRGDLRWREKPEIERLFEAIRVRLERYTDRLAALSKDHPMAPLSASNAEITASWSIRLTDGGHHVSHLHDGGLVSSAIHLVVPEGDGGALELGRPPEDIPLPLDPLETFTPLAGHLVLFPSFLYHGTTRFGEGERLTVAFDAR